MPRSRVVVPDTVKVPISDGDWIILKTQLNAREYREMMARLVDVNVKLDNPAALKDTAVKIDPLAAGESSVLAYLVEWSLTDPQGLPIPLYDKDAGEPMPIEYRRAALGSIDFDSYMEV